MKMIRYTTLLIVPGIAICLTSCGKVQNRMTIINSSPVKADRVTVSVCGQDVVFQNIDSGREASQGFPVTGDSGFTVSAAMSDGTVATNSFGYVTGGTGSYGNHVEIEITSDKSIKGKQL